MKKVKIEERFQNAANAFFADESFAPAHIAVRERDCDLQNRNDGDSTNGSFGVWAFAKCLLFYVPGVALLFFVTLALTQFLIFQAENIGNFTFAFFWIGFGAFLTMFGIGKLGDLRYLKVVASVLLVSFAVGLSFFFVSDDLQSKFFGSYALYFLPLIAFIGYLTKKWVDNEANELS